MSPLASPPPGADAFASPESPSAQLLDALRSTDPSETITKELIGSLSETAVYHTLPLLLSALQLVGECTVDRETFGCILSVFRQRLLSSRVLKIRFLIHVNHPSFSAYWRVQTESSDTCYDDWESQANREFFDEPGEYATRGIEIVEYEEGECQAFSRDYDYRERDYGGDDIIENDDAGSGEGDNEKATIGNDFEEPYDDDDIIGERAFSRQSVKQVVLSIPVDSIDEQTVSFWRDDVFATDVEEGHQFSCGEIANPFYRGTSESSGENSEQPTCTSPYTSVGDTAVVRKVFSSIAQPKIVEVCKTGDGEENYQGEDGDENEQSVPPGVLVKAGDNLMQDLGVEQMFQLFNNIWASDDTIIDQFGKPPISIWYDVIPTDMEHGLMQAVGGLEALQDFDWSAWREAHGDDEDAVQDMVRSAAGAYIATYIVGGRDRHFHNILVHEGRRLVHIDFTYILGGGPPIDAPPIAIASEMEEAFSDVGAWETFVDLCGAAFASARRVSSGVLRIAGLSFVRTGLKARDVARYLRGKSSLNLSEDRQTAVDHVTRQVRDSAHSAQTWFKRVAHDVIDPFWYGLLKKGFPPAVAIMSALDKSENKAAQQLAQELAEGAASVTGAERLEM